jgi:SAM-dependent methyltransferase
MVKLKIFKLLLRGLKNGSMLLVKGDLREFSIRLRISLGQIDLKNDPTEEISERTHYYADSGGIAFDKIMANFDVRPEDGIIDFGCGKGGVLISLSKYPFSKISGVEISPTLAETAKRNVEKLNIRNIDIVCCDAANFKNLDSYNFFYFFDPFPCIVMEAVLCNIAKSIIARPRKVILIYLNPFCYDLLESRSDFEKIAELPHFEHQCFIYTNSKLMQSNEIS